MDAADPAVEARLSAYVWAEKPERLDRLRRAIAMVRARPVRLDKGDAADWVEARLAEPQADGVRSEEHTSELQSLMRRSYDVFCLKKKKTSTNYSKYKIKQ